MNAKVPSPLGFSFGAEFPKGSVLSHFHTNWLSDARVIARGARNFRAYADLAASYQERVWSSNSTRNRVIRMPSGAGHDAQVLATIMPAGMLFVPSIGGISHHWTENTDDADIVTGVEVFVDACRRLLA